MSAWVIKVSSVMWPSPLVGRDRAGIAPVRVVGADDAFDIAAVALLDLLDGPAFGGAAEHIADSGAGDRADGLVLEAGCHQLAPSSFAARVPPSLSSVPGTCAASASATSIRSVPASSGRQQPTSGAAR